MLALALPRLRIETHVQVKCGPIHRKGHCDCCSAPLPKGRRAWCSDECKEAIVSNHDWQSARSAVLKRDGYRCVVCGADDQCISAKQFRRWNGRTFMEVNHINPVNGRRRHLDCQNHQENLETLCHDCHVNITAQQRELGLISGTRRHIWKIAYLFGAGYLACARCGSVDTSFHPKGKEGSTVFYWKRANEECSGPLLRDLKKR